MPIFDFPLTQLETYHGCSPLPQDFSDYWKRALDELELIAPEPVLKPADFTAPGAECFDLWFTGAGQARIHARLVRPEVRHSPGPAVVMFHGYQGHCGDWFSKLPWAAAGMTVAALDVRGQAGASEDTLKTTGSTFRGHILRGAEDENPDALFFRNVYLDTVALARVLMSFPWVDACRTGTTGYSQGGALALACAALEPRIRACAPVYPFLSDFRRIWNMDLCQDAYEEFRLFFRLRDPLHMKKELIFQRLGYLDIQNHAPQVHGEVLWLTALMDTWCPPSTQYAAYNKLTCPKEIIHYPNFGHEPLPGADDMIFRFFLQRLGGW